MDVFYHISITMILVFHFTAPVLQGKVMPVTKSNGFQR